MIHRLLADGVLLLHFLFLVFVVGGGFLVLRWPRLAWIHIPVFLWGTAIEFGGWICPLTPLENHLRRLGGSMGYQGGFIEHYILPVVYPSGLTREAQLVLGTVVLALNLLVYGWVLFRRRAGSSGH